MIFQYSSEEDEDELRLEDLVIRNVDTIVLVGLQKWLKFMLYFVLDVHIVNTFILYALTNQSP